jgi:hypothetical protein
MYSFFKQFSQFASGVLTLSTAALRAMEEASPSDLELEQNMGLVGECAGAGGDDECAQAANIYQCGRDKAPAVTNAMQAAVIANGGNDDAAEVRLFFFSSYITKNNPKCSVIGQQFKMLLEIILKLLQTKHCYSECSDTLNDKCIKSNINIPFTHTARADVCVSAQCAH